MPKKKMKAKKNSTAAQMENTLAEWDGIINARNKPLKKVKVKKYKLLQENYSPHAWAAILLALDVVPMEQIQHVATADPMVAVDVINKLKIREIEISVVGIKAIREA